MTKKVYTISKNDVIKVVSRQKFVDELAIIYSDTDVVGGWCGISIANYQKGESVARKIAQKNCGGYLFQEGCFRVFQSWEDFERHVKTFNCKYEDIR